MTHPTDWSNLGVFPLQDQSEEVPIDMRLQLVAGRVEEIDEYARPVFQKDSIGDVHPWRMWPKASRFMPSWAQVFAALVVGGQSSGGTLTRGDQDQGNASGSGRTGGTNFDFDPVSGTWRGGARPVRSDPFGGGFRPADDVFGLLTPRASGLQVQPIRAGWYGDSRYETVAHSMPACWPTFPNGWAGLALAGTEESGQRDLFIPADPRLVAVNASGPASAGTPVIDLQPDRTPNTERSAPLQSLMRIVRFGSGVAGVPEGPAIAVQHTKPRLDNMTGYGTCIGKADENKAQTTPGDNPGPVDPRDVAQADPMIRTIPEVQGSEPEAEPGSSGPGNIPGYTWDPVAGVWRGERTGGGHFGGPGDTAPDVDRGLGNAHAETMCGNDKLESLNEDAIAVFFLAHEKMYGPIHPGHVEDKHHFGFDEDGHPINSGHIASKAYYYDTQERDGPFHYEGRYPEPDPYPNISRVHLTWHKSEDHEWAQGKQKGKWKWFAEFADFGSSPPQTPPVETPPDEPPVTTPPDEPLDPPSTPGDDTPEDTPGSGTPGSSTPGPVSPGTGPSAGPGVPGFAGGPTGFEPEKASVSVAPTVYGTGPIYSSMQRNLASGFASMHWRPQKLVPGGVDYRWSMKIDRRAQKEDDLRRPTVAREEAYAAGQQDIACYVYDVRPEDSPWPGGLAAGGTVFMPPYVTLSDYDEDLETPGIPSSKAYRVMAPGTALGFGLPDLGTGDMQSNAIRIIHDGAGTLSFEVRGGGGWSECANVDASGIEGKDELRVNGTRVVGPQDVHIDDASTSHSIAGGDTVDASAVASALDALGTKVNEILTMVENHGLVATS